MTEGLRRSLSVGARLTVLLPVALFGAWAGRFIQLTSFVCEDGVRRYCLFDDAMISMRYAWNLSHGDGLVWNPGEYVEGITNLLMTLYMSLWTAFLDKGDAVLAVQISGAVFLAAGAIFCARLLAAATERMGFSSGPFIAILVVAASLSYYPLNYWSLMGMENSLLALLVAAALWRSVRTAGEDRPDAILGVLLGLAFLTRPDTALLSAAVLAHRAWGVLRREVGPKKILVEAGVLVLFIGGVTLFRCAYYGEPLPNTHRLKLTGTPLEARLANGWIFVKPYLRQMKIPFALGALGVALCRDRNATLLLAVSVIPVLYQIWVGGDAWNTWRLMSVTVPVLFVLDALAAAKLVNLAGWSRRALSFGERWPVPLRSVLTVLAVGAALAFAHTAANERFEKNLTFEKDPLYLKYSKHNTEIGLALNKLLEPTATMGLTWAGTIPYYSERRGIDFLGKVDRRIAALKPDLSGRLKTFGMNTLPGHNKYDLEYSMGELRPTYVYMYRWGRDNMSKMVRERYRRVRVDRSWLLVLKDSHDVNWELVDPRYRPGVVLGRFVDRAIREAPQERSRTNQGRHSTFVCPASPRLRRVA